MLSAETLVAVELDGPHHFDQAAYRRDRRKDALLQEHVYLVLRFLTQDVGEHLDDVLDTILRSISHRRTVNAMPSHDPGLPG